MPLLYVQEFLRVGHKTNGLNTPALHLDRQQEKSLATGAEDDGGLTIDFCYLHLIVLRQKAPGAYAKARYRIAPANRTQRGLLDFPTGISPQRHIFGQHMLQRAHLASLHRLHIAAEELPVGLRRRGEARSMLAQMLLGPAERTATGCLALAEYVGDFGKLVLEDFTQQEDSSLEGLLTVAIFTDL